jgi:hypothetical protein
VWWGEEALLRSTEKAGEHSAIRLGIGGFGRIGRMVFLAASSIPDVEVVINDLRASHLAYTAVRLGARTVPGLDRGRRQR